MTINLKNIEAIIFDLGGVILDIDINGVFKKFEELGIGTGGHGMEIIKTNKVFKQFERGELTPNEFRNAIRKESSSSFTDEEFDAIWNSMLLAYPVENIRLLEKLRINYRTFLMSNTNEIHYHFYSKMLDENFGYSCLDELFEKAYYSHTSGMRKPNPSFFEHLLQENKLIPEKTLFVDDFIENIESAMSLNINTFHINNGKTMVDLNELLFSPFGN